MEESNLITSSDKNRKIRLRLVSKKQELLIEVDNLDFRLVSKYLNELNGFVADLKKELAKSKENILGIIKKPRKK